MEALVDVIVPCYNAGQTIERCLESVINQGQIVNKIILVDDCSTDDTPLIISRYRKRLGLARLCYQRLERNSGCPAAVKNRCLNSVTAPFVAFLDSDDEWLSDKLEMQIREMMRHGLDYSYTSGYISNNGVLRLRKVFREGLVDIFSLSYRYDIMTQGYVVSTAILHRYNIRFNEDIVIGEDFYLYMQVALRGRGKSLGVPTFIYYIHSASITSRRFKRLLDGTRRVVRMIRKSSEFSLHEREFLLSNLNHFRRLRLARLALAQQRYSRFYCLVKSAAVKSPIFLVLTVSFMILSGKILGKLYQAYFKR